MKTTALTKRITANLFRSACIFSLLVLGPLSVLATIGTPVKIGAGGTDNPSATRTTISSINAPAGDTIIVVFAMDPKAGVATGSDSATNSYTTDMDVTNGSGDTGVRTLVFSARVVTAIVNGSITINHPSAFSRALQAFSISGLAASTPVDQTTSSTGSSSTPSTGPTAATTQADELVVAAFGYENDRAFIAGDDYTEMGAEQHSETGPPITDHVTIGAEYKIISATGTQSASATLGASGNYAAGIVTYKAAVAAVVPNVSSIVRANATPNGSNAVQFTVTFNQNVTGVDSTDFSLVTSGVSGASIASVSGGGTNYAVTIDTGTGSGTLGLNLVDDDSITDSSLTPIGGAGTGNGNFTGEVYTMNVASKLAFTTSAQTLTAGVISGTITIQRQDSSNQPNSRGAISVGLTSDSAGTYFFRDSADTTTISSVAIAIGSTSANFKYYDEKSGTPTLAATSAGPASSTQQETVNAAAAAAYRLSAATTTPGPNVADALTIALVDQFANIVTSFNGDKTLTFSGLATAADGTYPTVTDKAAAPVNLGSATTITFTTGQSTAGGVLRAYKAEGPVSLNATDGTWSTATAGGAAVVLTIANVAPVAGTDYFERNPNVLLMIPISALLTNDTDANHDLMNFVSISSPSTNGATIGNNANFVLYTPPSSNGNVTDRFTYTISDGVLNANGTVVVNIAPPPTGVSNNIVSFGTDGNGNPDMIFAGVPGFMYVVQVTADLSGTPVWTDKLTTNAPPGGLWEFIDTNRPSPAFYRAINQ